MCRIDGSDERSQLIVDNVKKFDARNFAKQLLPKVTELFFYVQDKKHALERLLSEQQAFDQVELKELMHNFDFVMDWYNTQV